MCNLKTSEPLRLFLSDMCMSWWRCSVQSVLMHVYLVREQEQNSTVAKKVLPPPSRNYKWKLEAARNH